MHVVGNAGAFTAEEQDIVGAEGEIRVALRCFRRGEDQAAAGGCTPFLEAFPIDMACQCGSGQIVHARALQVAIGNVEAGRFDDVDCKAKAGG